MSVLLNPYLSFRGQARAAGQFYQSVLGGELTVNTFKEFGMPADSAEADQVMHSQLTTPNGLTLMLSDTPAHMELTPGASIQISLSGDDEATLRGYWDRLSEGATVEVPLEKAPWGDIFGTLVDQFGINWMVDIHATPEPE